MEQKSKNISLKAILIAIGLGIWVIVLQNAGVIPKLVGTENGTQTVYVTGGNINADVNGSVSVDNTVDVNIHEINGHNQVTTGRGTHSVFPYGYMLPVDNW
ncbi:MAG TPA: hypothetical protein DHW31_12330 [Bacteroides graminisolvens]|uniref:Uncharacterized protein n=1 Tax=Bacteroides graminisolvens TaxID=477666 RepID=A0A3D2SI60_9BACE|nr:hypothetical protein [Bacteroides graminisolvens]